MRTTKEGLDLIKQFESCALTAYRDQEGRWTIGWGRARGINEGDNCTQEQADGWFLEDVEEFERLVLIALGRVEVNDNQLSALVSFCYNVGWGQIGRRDGFQILKTGEPSTMLKCLLAGDFDGAALEFPHWDHAGGVASAGLLRRRMAEQALFLKPELSNGKTRPFS